MRNKQVDAFHVILRKSRIPSRHARIAPSNQVFVLFFHLNELTAFSSAYAPVCLKGFGEHVLCGDIGFKGTRIEPIDA